MNLEFLGKTYKDILEFLQSKFPYARVVEHYDNEMGLLLEGYEIIYSTGEYKTHQLITIKLLSHLKDEESLNKIIEHINKSSHRNLEKIMFQKRYEESSKGKLKSQGRSIIVDTMCPEEESFTVIHPSKYAELRREFE